MLILSPIAGEAVLNGRSSLFFSLAMATAQSSNPDAPDSQRIFRASGWGEYLFIKLLGVLMRLWYATLRVRKTERFIKMSHENNRPNVFLLWHNRIFIGPWIYHKTHRKRAVYTMVSASKDGAVATALAENLGIRTVRGSSSRRALQSLREMLGHLNNNCDVVITPDGPRGPVYSMSASAALLLRHSRARIVLLNCTMPKAWRMKSWDGLYLPKPFSVVELDSEVLEDTLRVKKSDDYQFRDLIQSRYNALTIDTVAHPRPHIPAESSEGETDEETIPIDEAPPPSKG